MGELRDLLDVGSHVMSRGGEQGVLACVRGMWLYLQIGWSQSLSLTRGRRGRELPAQCRAEG